MGRDYLRGVLLFFFPFYLVVFLYLYTPCVCLLSGLGFIAWLCEFGCLCVWVFFSFPLNGVVGGISPCYYIFCPSSEGTMMDGWAGKIAMFSGQVQVSRRRRREQDTSRRDWVGTVQICVHTRASSG